MSSYSTIISELARLFDLPEASATGALNRSVDKMSPQAERRLDAEVARLEAQDFTRAWATQMAFQAVPGFRWPYWINAQLSPLDIGLPVGQSSPVLQNLTSRDCVPLLSPESGNLAGTVDRRGLVTPVDERSSLETWFLVGESLVVPACALHEAEFTYIVLDHGIRIQWRHPLAHIEMTACAERHEDNAFIRISASVAPREAAPTTIFFGIRPYTLHGLVPVYDLVYNSKGFWMSDSRVVALFQNKPAVSWASDGRLGDAPQFMAAPPDRTAIRCSAGLATCASAFSAKSASDAAPLRAEVLVPLMPLYPRELPLATLIYPGGKRSSTISPARKEPASAVPVAPQNVFKATSRRQLLAASDITTRQGQENFARRNHWLVPAVRALLLQEEPAAASRLLSWSLLGQHKNGYLPQSHGKWAFPGQVLSAAFSYGGRHGVETIPWSAVQALAQWITRKRREISHAPKKPSGLLPPGLPRYGGAPDYNVADNIWAVEGLIAASGLARLHDHHTLADHYYDEAQQVAHQLKAALQRELEYGLAQHIPARLHRSFDAATAAELLDLALLPETLGLLQPADWFPQLIRRIRSPLDSFLTNDRAPITLLQMDSRGLFPARRLMLLYAEEMLEMDPAQPLDSLEHHLSTSAGVWPEAIHPLTRRGTGVHPFDAEAAALHLLLLGKVHLASQ